MRNTKKLIAVIMTVAILASMMVPALAAVSYQTEADKLVAVGLMKGTDKGTDLESMLDRLQGITFTIRAMGEEEAAVAMTEADIAAVLATVTDAKTMPTWGRGYAAYAVKEGITLGVSSAELRFAPFAKLSGTQFITMMLRTLGYTGITLENCLDKAIAVGMLTTGKAVEFGSKANLNRDGAAYIIYSTVMNGLVAEADGVTASKTPLIGKLVADGVISAADAKLYFDYTAPAPATTAAFKFTAVALNAIQFKLTVDQALNADDAKDEAFYAIKDHVVGDASLQTDGSVILTITNGVALGNNSKAEITLKKDIRNAAGIKNSADFTVKDIPVFDTTFPTFDSVQAVGLKTLRLYYSEPVWGGVTVGAVSAPTDFTVKNSTYTWSVSTAKLNILDKYIELTLGTNLIEGNVDVTTKNSIKDFAGNLVAEKTIAYTFVKDTTAPVASIKSASQKEVVVKFNKPVYGYLKVAHSNKDTYYKLIPVVAEADAKDEFTVDFTTYPLPAGNVTIYVMAQADQDVKDLYGNKLVETVLTTTITLDVTAPVVSSTKVDGKANYQVTFDEKVDKSVAETASNYTLKKADGTSVLFTATLDTTGKIVTIDPVTDFADLTAYTLTIKKAKDLNGNTTSADIVLTFTTGDNTNPSIENDTFAVNDDGKIYIYFSEPMNATEMVKKANYLVSKTSGAAFVALGDDDSISAISDKIVLIDLKSGETVNLPAVQVSTTVVDLAGKKLSDNALSVSKSGITQEVFTIDAAEATAKNKIKLTFTKELSSFNAADLLVANAAVAAVESVSGKAVVIVLTADLSTDAKSAGNAVTVQTVASPASTKSVYGTLVDQIAAVTVSDKIVPEVTKTSDTYNVVVTTSTAGGVVATKNTSATIVVSYSEVMDAASFSNLTYSVAGYSIVTVAASGSTVTITAKTDADNTSALPTVTQVYNVKDANGNVLASGTVYETK